MRTDGYEVVLADLGVITYVTVPVVFAVSFFVLGDVSTLAHDLVQLFSDDVGHL